MHFTGVRKMLKGFFGLQAVGSSVLTRTDVPAVQVFEAAGVLMLGTVNRDKVRR